MIGYVVMGILFAASMFFGLFAEPSQAAEVELRTWTVEELSAFDGKDGSPSYTSYEGIIYDVSESPLFEEGEHFGHFAGMDLTEAMAEAPHGDEVFVGFNIVGQLEGDFTEVEQSKKIITTSGQIRIFGKTLTAWTGYLLGVVLILNFATCYAMPWCKGKMPWKGWVPGPDNKDHMIMQFFQYHRVFAWLTIFFGIIHGVIGILESFQIRI